MVRSFIAVGAGAAIGAWMRWGLSLWLAPARSPIPLGTLAANLIGGYIVGIALGWIIHRPGVAPELRLFLVTGLLGGLTTFSTFSAEVTELLQSERWAMACAAIALHVSGSLAMTLLGLLSWRWMARA